MTNLELINRAYGFTSLAVADFETCKANGIFTHRDIEEINRELQTASCAMQQLQVNLRQGHNKPDFDMQVELAKQDENNNKT